MRLINLHPTRGSGVLLGVLPLLLILLFYTGASAARHAENTSDKLLPTFSQMVESTGALVTRTDPTTGDIPLVADTSASLTRLGIGLAIATGSALVLGLVIGTLPLIRSTLGPLVGVIAVIPPIAVLPILFITFGLGEASKIALVVIGIMPAMIRDLSAFIAQLPQEQIIKAQTLGANSWQVMMRVALPQALPRLISIVRLQLGAAWVFLIAAEAIAADVGLGYRIFLVRRYMSMDIILPYVAWISLLAIIMDYALVRLSRIAFAWAHEGAR
ncbi:ABC transporter permease [Altericroceibacterium xinjiangense]|uniref:ABC transporter permease n=1 Tax=Altericroceibacterium xinjiangense TaxID=762261 RepID=UPI000F7F5F3C